MANSKLKNCKVCGAVIAKNAKSCPNCGARIKKNTWWIVLIVVVLLVAMISTISNKDDNQPKVIDSNQDGNTSVSKAETTATPIPKTKFGIGERVELKNVICTLIGIQESEGSAYNKPGDGNVFILCEFEIENNTDAEITVSSLLSFQAYCDNYTCNFSLSALLEKGNKNQLDGQIAGGKKFNGVVAYEVPADWKELELHFKPEFWSGKEFIFVADH